MSKRKEAPADGKDSAAPATMRRQAEEYSLAKTRDIGEARGFIFSGLDPDGTALKELFASLESGARDVFWMGEPMVDVIRPLLDAKPQEGYDLLAYDFKTNRFLWKPSFGAAPSATEISLSRERLTAIYENLQPTASTRAPSSSADSGEPALDSTIVEEDPLDLAVAWEKYARSDKSPAKVLEVRKFIDDVHASFKQKLSDRSPYTLRGVPLWEAVRKTLEDVTSKKKTRIHNSEMDSFEVFQGVANLVFNLEKGEIANATVETSKLGPLEIPLFSTLDVHDTFEFCRVFPGKKKSLYKPLVEKITSGPSSLLYRGESLELYLKRTFPILAHAERQQSFALLFYSEVAEFELLRMKPTLDVVEANLFRQRVAYFSDAFGAIIVSQTMPSELVYGAFPEFGSRLVIADDLLPKYERVGLRALFSEVIRSDKRINESWPTKRTASQALMWSVENSSWNVDLKSFYASSMLAVGYPQSAAAELIWMAAHVYKSFKHYERFGYGGYDAMIHDVSFLKISRDSLAGQALEFCSQWAGVAEKNGFQDEAYELFIQAAITLAKTEKFSVAPPSKNWERLSVLDQRYMRGSGKYQAALEELKLSTGATLFGNKGTELEKALSHYEMACLLRADETAKKEEALLEEIVKKLIDAEIASAMKDYAQGPWTGRRADGEIQFDILQPDCRVELVDDLVNAAEPLSLSGLYVGPRLLEVVVGEHLRARGKNIMVIFLKKWREIEILPNDLGPIKLRAFLDDRYGAENAVLLYPSLRPRERLRTRLMPEAMRKASSTNVEYQAAQGSPVRSEVDADEAAETERALEESGPGSFANKTHQRLYLLRLINTQLSPVQIGNTAWRELLRMAVFLYRNRSVLLPAQNFQRWRATTLPLINDGATKTFLERLANVAGTRLERLVRDLPSTKQGIDAAYEQLFDEIAQEAQYRFDEAALTFDDRKLRRYAANEGFLQKTVDFLYEKYYSAFSPPDDIAKAFVDLLDLYADNLQTSDDVLTRGAETLTRYLPESIMGADKIIWDELYPSSMSFLSTAMLKELCAKLFRDAPLKLYERPLRVSIDEALERMTKRVNVAQREAAKKTALIYLCLVSEAGKPRRIVVAAVPRGVGDEYLVSLTPSLSVPLSLVKADSEQNKLIMRLEDE